MGSSWPCLIPDRSDSRPFWKAATLYSQFDYGYKVDGATTSWTKTLGTADPVDMLFTYDPIDRLMGATYKDGAAVLAQYGYTYDKADNRTTERIDDLVRTGAYNNVNELTALSGGGLVNFSGTTSEEADVTVGGQTALTTQLGMRFEKAIPLSAGTNTVTVTAEDPSGNLANQDYEVVIDGGLSQSFTYDANGNLTDDGVRTYDWDAENRLIKITEGTRTTDIEYDGFHNWTRILEKDGTTTLSDRRFIWVENELVEQRNGTSTTAVQRYFPQGVQQGSDKYFYTRDHLGSIREVVDNSGSVVARYDYDPYGRRTKLSGGFDSDFGFTGHYYHEPSGLHFAPFRAYSAELGRWISRDPIGEVGGINLYTYVSNNPVNAVDPLGSEECPCGTHWGLNLDCYSDCIERYRNPLGNMISDAMGGAAAHLGNAAGNLLAGPTGRTGVDGVKSHATSWQHKLGSKLGPVGSKVGRFAGRAAIVATVFDGFFDLGLFGGCAIECMECVPD